jgi:phospholipid/cholesterol/gamma-HCH transport system substrate-binding protein
VKALLALLLSATGLLGAGWGVWSQSQPYEVTGYFQSADELVSGNAVVLNGVPVGTVEEVSVAPDSSAAGALVKMKLDSKYAPIHRGTRAAIRPQGILGAMYVELTPGGGAAIPRGGAIPLQDTAAPVTLDEVDDIFDPATRERIHTLTIEGGKTFAGAGPDVNTLLQTLPQLSRDAQDISGQLAAKDQELDAVQQEFDKVATMIADESEALKRDLANGAAVLQVLAQHEQKLQEELVYANAALAKLNAALGGHERDLNQILKQTPALLDDLQSFQQHSTTALSILHPCVGDVLAMLAEMQSATQYKTPGGSSDGQGYELRTDSAMPPPANGSFSGADMSCSGGGGTQP